MNQVTTQRADDGSSKIVPALGELRRWHVGMHMCCVRAQLDAGLTRFHFTGVGNSWAHQATTRMILYWEGDQRRAHLYKSPSLPATSVDFFVTEAGIRGRKAQKRPRD